MIQSCFSGGWNNNPTVQQFQAAFRRLITRCGAAEAGSTGNVIAQDSTELFQASTSVYLPPTVNFEDEEEASADIILDPMVLPAHLLTLQTTPLLGNILVYISGWVVKKTLKKLKCDRCRQALVTEKQGQKYGRYFAFLRLKNNGGLILPSDGVISIVLSAEHHLRTAMRAQNSKRLKLLELQKNVLSDVGQYDLLNLGDHIGNSAVGIDNHHFSIIRIIAEVFYELRQHHIAKIHNLHMHRKNIRQNNNKIVLFLGQ